MGGTSFCGANLTEANFKQAILKVQTSKALCETHTSWCQPLSWSKLVFKELILASVQVRQLVITKDGREKNYDRLDLED
jgi:uncharacterized protein YjbI with pentapeptide repeats